MTVNARRAWSSLFFALCAVTGALALAFTGRETIHWQELSTPLLLGTIALAAAVLLHAWLTTSARNALLFFLLATGISLAAEYAGIRWGFPFGARFRYHPDLRLRLFGLVPLFIPLAWMVLAYIPIVQLRQWPRENQRPRLSMALKAVTAAAMLCVADLTLDPLAVAVGAWTWEQPGAYYGIPAGNFLGWLLVGFVIFGCYFALERPTASRSASATFVYDRHLIAVSLYLIGVGQLALLRHVPGAHWITLITVVTVAPGLYFWVSRRRQGPPELDSPSPDP